jgi:hypothetical protein
VGRIKGSKLVGEENMRHHCEKTTTDPSKHKGPFKHLKTFESNGKNICAAEKCEACGKTVIRDLNPEKPGQELGLPGP